MFDLGLFRVKLFWCVFKILRFVEWGLSQRLKRLQKVSLASCSQSAKNTHRNNTPQIHMEFRGFRANVSPLAIYIYIVCMYVYIYMYIHIYSHHGGMQITILRSQYGWLYPHWCLLLSSKLVRWLESFLPQSSRWVRFGLLWLLTCYPWPYSSCPVKPHIKTQQVGTLQGWGPTVTLDWTATWGPTAFTD